MLGKKYFISIALLFFLVGNVFSEGTKEITPNASDKGKLCLSKNSSDYPNFAIYGTQPENRLHIHISSLSEKICIGFGNVLDYGGSPSADPVYYRLRDPNGYIVLGAAGNGIQIPSSGAGYIGSRQQAMNGPAIVHPDGYDPIVYQPVTTGDFYIEFDYTAGGWGGSYKEFEFFDITVVNQYSQAINGRLWSKQWLFSSDATSGANYFNGTLYAYADDSVVTSFKFNNFVVGVASVACNPTGTNNSGNFIQDRKSRSNRWTYPQYKLFLNDPDSVTYPTGSLGAITETPYITGCPPDDFFVNVNVNKAGIVTILLDMSSSGYTNRELIFECPSSGTHQIPWDGKDGAGVKIESGTVIDVISEFKNGLTHLPMFDVEIGGGFTVKVVRPEFDDPAPDVFWDDTQIGGSSNLLGCSDTINGCHPWNNWIGDMNTVNTWWFAPSLTTQSFVFDHDYIFIDVNETLILPISCNGLIDGEIKFSVRGGDPPYKYSLDGGPFQYDSVFMNLPSGWHTVVAKDDDGNGCPVDTTFFIDDKPPITLNSYMWEADTCSAEIGKAITVPITGTAPYIYEWDVDSAGNNDTVLNLKHGWVYLKVSDQFTCQFDTVFIEHAVYDLDGETVTKNDTCVHANGWIYVEESEIASTDPAVASFPQYPFTYDWSTDSTTYSPDTLLGDLEYGPYSVVISDKFGCNVTILDTIELIIPDMDIHESVFPDTCEGNVGLIYIDSVSLSSNPLNFYWHLPNDTLPLVGADTGFLQNIDSGTYHLQITDKHGCIIDTIYEVTQFDSDVLIDSIQTKDDTCGYHMGWARVFPSGGTEPYYGYWNTIPPQDSTIFTGGLTDSTYKVLVYDKNRCLADTFSFDIVNFLPEIQFDSLVWPDTCLNEIGRIFMKPHNGLPPYDFDWRSHEPNTFISDTAFEATKLPVGTYNLLTTDQNNCIDTAFIEIENYVPEMIDTIYSKRDTCSAGIGSAGVILDSISGPPYYMRWNTDPPYSSNFIDGLYSGHYIFVVTDKYGCEARDTIFVDDTTIHLASNIYLTESDTCAFGVGKVYVSDIENASMPLDYSWINPYGQEISNDSVAYGLTAENRYEVIISDRYGCLDSNEVVMENYFPDLVDTLVTTPDQCESNSGTASVFTTGITYGYEYIWNTEPIQSTAIATNIPDGNYSVTVTDKFGCLEIRNFTIDEGFYEVDPQITMVKDTCYSGVGKLIVDSVITGEGPFNYLWYSVNDTITPVAIGRKGTGLFADSTYKLVIIDGNKCQGRKIMSVGNASSEIAISLETIRDNCNSGLGSVSVNVEDTYGPYEFVWNNDTTLNDSVLANLHEGEYSVLVMDKFNCSAAATAEIIDLCNVIIPNVLTPNKDGFNDYLDIENIEFYPGNLLSIYDRWGKLVFEQKDYRNEMKWEGTNMKGEKLSQGVYFYVLNLNLQNGGGTLNGNITLLR